MEIKQENTIPTRQFQRPPHLHDYLMLDILFPMRPTSIFAKMRSRGSLGTAQSVLQKAISRRESVGESYLGFMSDVREELEVRYEVATLSLVDSPPVLQFLGQPHSWS